MKPRRGDRIIVQEKIDGSCVSVANIDGEIVALTRSGYRCQDVTYEHLRLFEHYVEECKDALIKLLQPNERLVGEWLPMAHGTEYDPNHPDFSLFTAFDIFRDDKRILFDEFKERVDNCAIRRAYALHDDSVALSVEDALDILGEFGFHGAIEQIEGAVWRVEREGRVDFLAKFVRHDKIDGKYFNQEPNWYWYPVWDGRRT